MSDKRVINNIDKKRYELVIDGYLAKIDYIEAKGDTIYLTHTEVPQELEGKGIGSYLVEEALKDIEKRNFKLVPMCPFVASYVNKHSEWNKIIK